MSILIRNIDQADTRTIIFNNRSDGIQNPSNVNANNTLVYDVSKPPFGVNFESTLPASIQVIVGSEEFVGNATIVLDVDGKPILTLEFRDPTTNDLKDVPTFDGISDMTIQLTFEYLGQ